VWIALCTVTVRLATLAKAFGEGAAKKPLAGSQLRDPRAKFALGRREARAMNSRINWFFHLRSIYYLRLGRMSTQKMQCEFAQHLKKGPTVGESNAWITQKTSLRNHWGRLWLNWEGILRQRVSIPGVWPSCFLRLVVAAVATGKAAEVAASLP